MVPDFIDPSVVVSERRVFACLRSASGSENWTVLHSLGISSDWTGEFAEIDFVVIMPGNGIVCIEVKGGAVSVHNGVWTTLNRRGEVETLRRSPYRQAQEGMWKLLAAIRTRLVPTLLKRDAPSAGSWSSRMSPACLSHRRPPAMRSSIATTLTGASAHEFAARRRCCGWLRART
jgi:hypothetical protein